MLKDSPRLYPGAAELVQALRGRLRLAVVTGTWRKRQDRAPGRGLEDAFELIVAKEDVLRANPPPKAIARP